MEPEAYDELLRHLTALIMKMDDRDTRLVAMLEEQREFNKQQLEMNRRLETMMERALQQRSNGQGSN